MLLSNTIRYEFASAPPFPAEQSPWTPLVFHHIPKTAGSSFTQHLRTLFPPHAISVAATDSELASLLESNQIHQYGLFTGHYSYEGLIKYLGDGTLLTFLRDPIERVISQFYNWHDLGRIPSSWNARAESLPSVQLSVEKTKSLSLAQFVQSTDPNISDSAQNMLTRYLAPVCPWGKKAGYVDETLLATAKSNLQNSFRFFGIAEFYEESLLLLAVALGVRPWRKMDSLYTNVNPKKKGIAETYSVSKDERELIASYNQMDIQLYEFGLKLFRERLNSLLYNSLESAYKLGSQARQPSRLEKEQLKVSVGTGYGCRGFHYAERAILEDGQAFDFRWSGLSNTCDIELPLRTVDCKAVEVCLHVLGFISQTVRDGMLITLDGVYPDTISQSEDGGVEVWRCYFTIPPTCANWSNHFLAISVGREFEGHKQDESRFLGICLTEVTARCVRSGEGR